MRVTGLGDVVQVSDKIIFYKDDEGIRQRKKVTKEKLDLILEAAIEAVVFYSKSYAEIQEVYEKRKLEAEKKYHYITDEDIQAEYKANGRSSKWFDMTVSKDSHNENCKYEFGKVFGIGEMASVIMDRKWEADKIYRQAKNAYNHLG